MKILLANLYFVRRTTLEKCWCIVELSPDLSGLRQEARSLLIPYPVDSFKNYCHEDPQREFYRIIWIAKKIIATKIQNHEECTKGIL